MGCVRHLTDRRLDMTIPLLPDDPPTAPSDPVAAARLERAALALENARLLDAEQQARRAAESGARRTARLQAVTSSLAEALTPAQVAEVVTAAVLDAVGAYAGGVLLLSGDGEHLEIIESLGYPGDVLAEWQRYAVSLPVPSSEAVRTGEAVWVASREQLAAHYPALIDTVARTGTSALAAVPLLVHGRVIGTLNLSFAVPQAFPQEDRDFILVVARQCAQSLERASLYDRERVARATAEAAQQRLRFLSEASAVLSSSLDYETTLGSLARLIVPRIADWCAIDVVEPAGTIRRLTVAHADPAKLDRVKELATHARLTGDTPAGPRSVIDSGRAVLVSVITDAQLVAAARSDAHLSLMRELGPRSTMIVPVIARGRALGAITLVSAESGRHFGQEDLALVEDLAGRAAVAVDNARLYREAQEALTLRDEFIASISHDLRTPLTLIKGLAQLLARQASRSGTAGADRLVEGLGRIDAATTKMVTLIGDLLDLARLQTGRPLELHRERLNLVALVEQLVTEHQRGLQEERVRLRSALPEIYGAWDPARLERVFSNLLSNAIKYSPDGGAIIVSVAQDQDMSSDQPSVRVVVQDQGMGIPAADMPRIFERFYRGSNVEGRVAGTGIGLAGSRQIVEQHGGTITLESTEGAGATVTVRLPLT